MKNNMTKTAAALTLLVMLLLTVGTNAQSAVKMTFTANETASLVNAINSDNAGLKKSAIYFAGRYRVYEAVDALTGVLDNEKDAKVRLLAAKALFEIGDDNGMKAVYKVSKNDKDVKVRRMSKVLFNEYEQALYENRFTTVE